MENDTFTLAELRGVTGEMSQSRLATRMHSHRQAVARLEQRSHCATVAMIRRYVTALGGELVIVARFGDVDVTLEL